MDHRTFDGFARRAAAVFDRRAAFGLLTGSALGSMLSPLTADADKKKGGGSKSNKKRGKRRFNHCIEGNPRYCARNFPDQKDECVTDLDRCCEFFKKCQGRKGFQCCVNAGWCD